MEVKRLMTTTEDLFLFGIHTDNNVRKVEITDDYERFLLYKNDQYVDSYETDGFASFVTKDQLREAIDELVEEMELDLDEILDPVDLLFIPSGTRINIGVKREDGSTTNDFDLGDFILPEFDDYSEVFFQVDNDLIQINNLSELNQYGFDFDVAEDTENVERRIDTFDNFSNPIDVQRKVEYRDDYYGGLSKSELDDEINKALDDSDFDKLKYLVKFVDKFKK